MCSIGFKITVVFFLEGVGIVGFCDGWGEHMPVLCA